MEEEPAAYDVRTREKARVENPKPAALKNGRKATACKSAKTGIVLFRIMGQKQAMEFEKAFGKTM